MTTQGVRSLNQRAVELKYLWLGLLIVVVIAIGLLGSPSIIALVAEMVIMGAYAVSYNLIFGTAGVLSFGHAMFFGLGAYAFSLALKQAGLPFEMAFVASAVVGCVASVIVAALSLHLRWLYCAFLTFAFAQLAYTLIYKMRGLTGGDDGLLGINPPSWLNSPTSMFFFTVVICAICIYALLLIHNSPFGAILRGIRENPERVKFCGLNVRWYRMTAFVIGGTVAGITGGLFAMLNRAAFVDYLSVHQTNVAIFGALMGGISTFFGPIVGAVVMVLLDKQVGRLTEYWSFGMGAIMVLILLFFPQGILGYAKERFEAWRK